MLNIDVQGARFPNPLTMVVQLCTLLVIFLACKKWLWLPIRGIIEKRAEAVQAPLTEAANLRDEAANYLDEAKKELAEAKKTSMEIVSSARTEAVSLSNEIITKANKEAQDKLDSAEHRIALHQQEIKDQMHDEMVSVAMAAVSKLLDQKATSSDDEAAIDQFVKEAKNKA